MKRHVRTVISLGLMTLVLSGCLLSQPTTTAPRVLPSRPLLEQSYITEEDGTLHIPKGDKEELMLYINTLEDQLKQCN